MNFLFQIDGEKSNKIGNISSLPSNISKDKIIFEKSESAEKLPTGPIEPKPGPTLLIQVVTAEKVSSKGRLLKAMRKSDKPITKIYITIYPETLFTMSSSSGLPSSLTLPTE